MTYNKPEIEVVGAAVEVIQMQLKPGTTGPDAGHYALVAAYDLDE